MDALNALGFKPICVLPDKRARPTKTPTKSHPKSSISSNFDINLPNLQKGLSSKTSQMSLLLLSSSLSTKFAGALTYEEALEQSASTNSAADFDATSVVESIINFGFENPFVIAGGIAIFALPLVLSRVLGKPKAFGVESAKNAYAKLGEDVNAELVDIRTAKDLREVGSPDVRGLSKKPVLVLYRGEDKVGFLKKLGLRFKEPENTTLYILDKFDGNSEMVAELVTANGFKAAYAIKDGAEGPRGWMNSGLPWMLPKKTLSLDFGSLTEAFSGTLEGGPDVLPVTLGIAAATGLGLLAFTEIETVLQLLGSAALVQFISKKLLFAEDRKQTLRQVDEFLSTKVAPKELVSDIKQIGTALLPTTGSNRALPPPAEGSETAATNDAPVAQFNAEPQAEAAAAPPVPEINSVPQNEVKAESPSAHGRALSPYPSYPDFKPPTSPCPSQP